MGVLHVAVPAPFDALVPRWIPGPARSDPMITHALRVRAEA
jgi:hypothetical protein